MKNIKITKWVLQEGIKGKAPLFLAKYQNRHGHDMVTLNDEDVLFLNTREVARLFAKGFEKLVVKKVTMIVE
jgi:hypothetical protein